MYAIEAHIGMLSLAAKSRAAANKEIAKKD
jgi:hypothetical protein